MCFDENLEGKYILPLKYITGDEMRIYLDTCCYNRQFDDKNSDRIILESYATDYIQNQIKEKKIELATSYMLHYENNQKNDKEIRDKIDKFFRNNRTIYIGVECAEELEKIAQKIMSTGIKEKDSYHVASAILSKSDYFITVDDRLLKYQTNEIKLMNPVKFLKVLESDENDDR